MSGVTNEDRAEWGLVGLQAFRDRTCQGAFDRDLTQWESFEEGLSDMLGDLMHYASRQGWLKDPEINPDGEDVPAMFERLLERGRSHYEWELAEEREKESA